MPDQEHPPIDQLIMSLDSGLRTLFVQPKQRRANPADELNQQDALSEQDKSLSASLMRVNHCGEICAQALYQAQAITARTAKIRDKMRQASDEENDHLAWCEQRLDQLSSHKSYLNPVWYAGSFAIGALAGLAGDKWSLGFVAETEHQVCRHLDRHLERLPENDHASRKIINQMRADEAKHATAALHAGGAELPAPIRQLMSFSSRVMTTIAARI